MAVGEPPHTNLNQLQVIQVIPKVPPPTLPEDQYSPEFRGFLSLCLKKEPEKVTVEIGELLLTLLT